MECKPYPLTVLVYLNALDEAGCEYVALKGWVMKRLYPCPEYRGMADIDILLKDYDYENISQVLSACGYKSEGSSSWIRIYVYDNYLVVNILELCVAETGFKTESSRIIEELMDNVVEVYTNDCKGNVNDTAAQLEMSASRVKKLLITAGIRDNVIYYTSDVCEEILELYKKGKSVAEIMAATGLGLHSVQGYLPYTKGAYKLSVLSEEAEKVRLFRKRQSLCTNYSTAIIGMDKAQEEEYLWKVLTEVAGRRFPVWDNKRRTAKQAYKINNAEIIFESIDKSVSKADVFKEYWKAKKKGVIQKAKIKNSTEKYLYPIFTEIQICKAE